MDRSLTKGLRVTFSTAYADASRSYNQHQDLTSSPFTIPSFRKALWVATRGAEALMHKVATCLTRTFLDTAGCCGPQCSR